MALSTGTISLSQVNQELGKNTNTEISLNNADVRSLAGKPSGTISMNDLRGKAMEGWSYTGVKIPLPYSLSANGSTQGIAWSPDNGSMYFSVIDNLNGNARIYGLRLNGQVSLGYTVLPNTNVTGVEVYNGRLYFTEDMDGYKLKSVVPGNSGSVRDEFPLGITDPFDIARDITFGYWYSVDRAGNVVYAYYSNGTIQRVFTPEGCRYPLACGGDANGDGIWIGDGQSGKSSVMLVDRTGATVIEAFSVADTVNILTGVTHDAVRNCIWVCGTKENAIYQYKEY